jgi:hypothetical protein
MAEEAAPIPDARTVWVGSSMTEAKIQSLVDRGLLRPKAEVEWKAAAAGGGGGGGGGGVTGGGK